LNFNFFLQILRGGADFRNQRAEGRTSRENQQPKQRCRGAKVGVGG
jgi:hypothetical protein